MKQKKKQNNLVRVGQLPLAMTAFTNKNGLNPHRDSRLRPVSHRAAHTGSPLTPARLLLILVVSLMAVACASPAASPIIVATPAATLSAAQSIVIPTLMPIAESSMETSHEEVEPIISTTFVQWVADYTAVEGATSSLTRMKHGLYMTFEATQLEPGEAYTVWWVIFDKPENCSDGACGVDDVFLVDEEDNFILTDEGARTFNLPGREATLFSEIRATGSIIDVDGTAEFRAHLPIGDGTEASFGTGLIDPMKAEVHLILRTHGAAIPGRIHEQMNTTWGGCPEGWPKTPCHNVQLSIHQAPSQ